MVCRLSTLFTLLHYLVDFVPTYQYQIPRVRPQQEPLHIDHAWIGKMLLVFPSVNEAYL